MTTAQAAALQLFLSVAFLWLMFALCEVKRLLGAMLAEMRKWNEADEPRPAGRTKLPPAAAISAPIVAPVRFQR